MIVWTGDNSPHNVWDNSEDEAIDATVSITKMIKDVFKNDVTIAPIHGNHDTWPIDQFDFSWPNSNRAIKSIADAWIDWLEPETLKTYRRFGYYSQKLKVPKLQRAGQNTKIIGVNTQACDNINFELLKTRYDPGD